MISPDLTMMFREAAEAGAACRRQRERSGETLERLGERLRATPPGVVMTLARGSSDNAATYGRYLIETRARTLTSSVAPSIASIYDASPAVEGALALAVSQSGASPDLVAAAEAARSGGALVVAIVNVENSPLAAAADIVVPLCAGPETSVAATKSFIASMAAMAGLVAAWTEDASLRQAMHDLPDMLDAAWALDWSPALSVLRDTHNCYVVGRGPGFGAAQEAALKLKETCGIHAEAFSAAEVRHGPMAIVENGFPILLFGQEDEGQASVADLAPLFAQRGARVMAAGVAAAERLSLPALDAHPAIQPMLLVQSFYRLANAAALARGRDPDRPPHLRKVTATL